jgi:hypothetical protein
MLNRKQLRARYGRFEVVEQLPDQRWMLYCRLDTPKHRRVIISEARLLKLIGADELAYHKATHEGEAWRWRQRGRQVVISRGPCRISFPPGNYVIGDPSKCFQRFYFDEVRYKQDEEREQMNRDDWQMLIETQEAMALIWATRTGKGCKLNHLLDSNLPNLRVDFGRLSIHDTRFVHVPMIKQLPPDVRERYHFVTLTKPSLFEIDAVGNVSSDFLTIQNSNQGG